MSDGIDSVICCWQNIYSLHNDFKFENDANNVLNNHKTYI